MKNTTSEEKMQLVDIERNLLQFCAEKYLLQMQATNANVMAFVQRMRATAISLSAFVLPSPRMVENRSPRNGYSDKLHSLSGAKLAQDGWSCPAPKAQGRKLFAPKAQRALGSGGGSPRKNFSDHAPFSPGNAPFYIRGGNTHPYASKICTCTQRENPLCSKILDQNLVFKCFRFKSETLWRHFMIAINLAGIMPSS